MSAPNDEYQPGSGGGNTTQNDYKSRTGQNKIPVVGDETRIEDPIDENTADSDAQLGPRFLRGRFLMGVYNLLTLGEQPVMIRTPSIRPTSSTNVRAEQPSLAGIASLVTTRVFLALRMEQVPFAEVQIRSLVTNGDEALETAT